MYDMMELGKLKEFDERKNDNPEIALLFSLLPAAR